jgi:dienelactone hydrolase
MLSKGPGHEALLKQGFQSFWHRAEVNSDLASGAICRPVFHAGVGPCLLLMHELPGLAQPCVDFARRLVARDFHVFMPLLVGVPLQHTPTLNIARLCISREFDHLRTGITTPIVAWLRHLAAHIGEEFGQRRIGAVGMCLTGAFAISLLIEPNVQAAVASQPGMPFSLTHLLFGPRFGHGEWERRLNISDDDVEAAARAVEGGKGLMIQRFADDRICPFARVERLARALPDHVQLYPAEPTSPLRPQSSRPPHAMLTEEFDAVHSRHSVPADDPTERALKRVVSFFEAHLRPQRRQG